MCLADGGCSRWLQRSLAVERWGGGGGARRGLSLEDWEDQLRAVVKVGAHPKALPTLFAFGGWG